jgi:hypothetical protein
MYVKQLESGEWALLEDDDTVLCTSRSVAEISRKKADLSLTAVIRRSHSGSASPLVDTPRG